MNTLGKKKIFIFIGCFLLIIGLIVILFACSTDNDLNEKVISADIAARLTEEYKQPVTVKEISITKSLSEDPIYSATVATTVEYAHASWMGIYEIMYTHYEQGWMLDSLHIVQEEMIAVIATPSVEELYEIVGAFEGFNGIAGPVSENNEIEFQWESISEYKHAKIKSTYTQTIEYNSNYKNWVARGHRSVVEQNFVGELTLDMTTTKVYKNERVYAYEGIMKIHEINNDTVVLDWGSNTRIEHSNATFTRAKSREEIDLEEFSFDSGLWYIGEDGYYLNIRFDYGDTIIEICANPYYMVGGHTRAYVCWDD